MPAPWRLWLSGRFAVAHYGFPFSVKTATTPVARLRALGFRARSMSRNPLRRWLHSAAMMMTWPIGAFFDALRDARAIATVDSRVSVATTLFDMYVLALTRNIPPMDYKLYRFDEPAGRADMHLYLCWNDLPALAALNARRGAENRDVQDKHRFAEICASHGLPHVPTLAVFDRGAQIAPDRPFVPVQPRLFVKNLRGKASMGAERWTGEGDRYHNTQAVTVPAAKLAQRLRGSDCIVQPCLDNHSSLATLTNGALACLRIVTAIDRAGRAEFIWAMLMLPFGSLKSSTTGIACRVSPNTGAITRAVDLWTEREIAKHPDTGDALIGFALPFWQESVALVTRTHMLAFGRFFSLGWDVGLTETGPVLLEANSGWGAVHHQMLEGPIGRTVFSRLVEEQLNG